MRRLTEKEKEKRAIHSLRNTNVPDSVKKEKRDLIFELNAKRQEEEKRARVFSLTKERSAVCDLFGISGVYFLVKSESVVYVGESACVISRISSHFLEKKKDFDSFYYIECSESERKDVEKKYIKKIKPIYNSTFNPDAAPLSKYGRKFKKTN